MSLQAQAGGPRDSTGGAVWGKSGLAVTGVGLASLDVGCGHLEAFGATGSGETNRVRTNRGLGMVFPGHELGLRLVGA